MNTTEAFAKTVLIILDAHSRWVSSPEQKAKRLIEDFRDENKKYEMVEDEYGDLVKEHSGFKNEELEKVLKMVLIAVEADYSEQSRYNSEKNKSLEKNLDIIKDIALTYSGEREEQ